MMGCPRATRTGIAIPWHKGKKKRAKTRLRKLDTEKSGLAAVLLVEFVNTPGCCDHFLLIIVKRVVL